METPNLDPTEVISALNSLLRGEISAVETYRQALEKLKDTSDAKVRLELESMMRSHVGRVDRLRERISVMGGIPDAGSGIWGALVKILERGATLIGDSTTIAVLEEGEDHGLKLYRKHLGELDAISRKLVEDELLPAQQKSHATLSRLKKTIH